jgi:hypothetical protein
MTTHAPCEERLAAVETARHSARSNAALPPSLLVRIVWRIIGSCKDEPAFDEVIACGRAFRCGEVPGLQSEDWTV